MRLLRLCGSMAIAKKVNACTKFSLALSRRYMGKLWPILSDHVCNNLRYYSYFDRCLGDIHNMMTSPIWWLATLTPAHLVSCHRDTLTAILCILWTESRIRQTGAFKNDQNVVFYTQLFGLAYLSGVFSFHGNFFKIRQCRRWCLNTL